MIDVACIRDNRRQKINLVMIVITVMLCSLSACKYVSKPDSLLAEEMRVVGGGDIQMTEYLLLQTQIVPAYLREFSARAIRIACDSIVGPYQLLDIRCLFTDIIMQIHNDSNSLRIIADTAFVSFEEEMYLEQGMPVVSDQSVYDLGSSSDEFLYFSGELSDDIATVLDSTCDFESVSLQDAMIVMEYKINASSNSWTANDDLGSAEYIFDYKVEIYHEVTHSTRPVFLGCFAAKTSTVANRKVLSQISSKSCDKNGD